MGRAADILRRRKQQAFVGPPEPFSIGTGEELFQSLLIPEGVYVDPSDDPFKVGKKEPSIADTIGVSDDVRQQWKLKGEIKAREQLSSEDWGEAIPFSPLPFMDDIEMLKRTQRITNHDLYNTLDPPLSARESINGYYPSLGIGNRLTQAEQEAWKQKDIEVFGDYLLGQAERQERGTSIGADIVHGVVGLPKFMIEFLATGPGAGLAKTAVKKAMFKYAKNRAARMATAGAAWIAAGAARTAQMAPTTGEAIVEELLPKGMQLTEKGKLTFNEAGKEPWKAIFRGFGRVMIENLSETAGPALSKAGKAVGKAVMPKRIAGALRGAWKKAHPGESASKLLSSVGYHGFIEEMGEESLGSLMRWSVGLNSWQDFVADHSGRAMLTKAGILAVPGAIGTAIGTTKTALVIRAEEQQKARLEAIDQFTGKPVQEPPAEQIVAGAEEAPEPPTLTPEQLTAARAAEPGEAVEAAARAGPEAIFERAPSEPTIDTALGDQAAVQQPAGPPAVATTEATTNIPDIETNPEKGTEMLNDWIGDRDVRKTEASIDARIHQGQLSQAVGEGAFQRIGEAIKGTPKAEEAKFNNAMHLYIDLKDVETREGITPQQELETYRDNQDEGRKPLSQEQLDAFELSQNLPPEIQAIADQIVEENRLAGQAAQEAEVLGTYREEYIARIWEKPSDVLKKQARAGKTDLLERATRKAAGIFAKFTQKTARQKRRTLHSVLDGWSLGKTLQVPGAIEASMIARQQIAQVIADRNFIKMGRKPGLFTNTRYEGFELVEHSNFQNWVHTGIVTEATDRHSLDIYINEKGQVFERRPIYAFAPLAQHLNKILGTSALYRIPGVAALTRFNAEMKAMRLFTSLFHHQAYIRSFSLASPGVDFIEGYKAGRKAINNFEPTLRLIVREGLTLGLSQDIETDIIRQKTAIGKLIDKVPMAAGTKNALLAMRDNQIDLLFNHLGPNLKAQAALLEFASRVRHNKKRLAAGKITEKEIARSVASALNNDFGGLNLMRIGRDPTLQHIFRLLALAPDWTESNIRSFVEARRRGELGRVHRAVIGRVIVRGMVSTVIFNALMAAMDDEETFFSLYQKQWKQGRLRWLDVDITPLYKLFGGQSEKRRYFSLLGHFKDPIRWIAQVPMEVFGVTVPDVLSSLLRTAKAKQSILAGLFVDLFTGTDWMGKRFTTYKERLGIDNKGLYQTTREGFYREGDRKGGKLKGQTTAWKWDKGGTVGFEEFPSYAIYEARRLTPIQVDNLIAWLMGEMDTFDAITRSLGVHVSTEVPQKPKKGSGRPEPPTIPKIGF